MIRSTVISVIFFTTTVLCNGNDQADHKQTEPQQQEHKLTDCPFARYKKTMEGYLIKSDPTEFFQGTFVDYYVAPARGETCDLTTYTIEANSQVTSVSTETFENKVTRVDCEERQIKIDNNGLYFIEGTYHGVKEGKEYKEKYDGKLYVFHADQDVIGYYYCEYVKGDLLKLITMSVDGAYNAVVSVKKDKIDDLIRGKDPGLKASVDKAINKMKKMAKEVNSIFAGQVTEEEYFNGPFAIDGPVLTDNKHLTC